MMKQFQNSVLLGPDEGKCFKDGWRSCGKRLKENILLRSLGRLGDCNTQNISSTLLYKNLLVFDIFANF